MRRALLVVAALWCCGALAQQRKDPLLGVKLKRSSTGGSATGQVKYATASEVFVDRGSDDGLEPGETLKLTRAGRAAGRCVVRKVADHSAVCEGSARVGDRFTFERTVEPPPKTRRQSPLSPQQLDRQREELEAAAVPLWKFEDGSARAQVLSRRVEVSLSHQTNAALYSSDGPFQHQWVDAAAKNIALSKSLSASLELSAVNWSRRPANFRSPYRSSSQLYVRQLEFDYRPVNGGLSVAAGRAWTRNVPGLSLLDGAQAGFGDSARSYEAGLFAGLLPDPLTLEPSTTRWTVGGYLSRTFSSGAGEGRVITPRLRAAYVTRPSLDSRAELDAALHAWVGRNYDAHVEAQLGVGDTTAPLLVDLVRVDAAARPADRLRLSVSGRYRGINLDEVSTVGVTLPGNRALHADGLLTFDVTPAVVAGATGSTMTDLSSGLEQHRAGVELGLPVLFGRRGGLTLGYAEQLGWLRGRDGFAQLVATPGERLRVIARVSYFAQTLGTPGAPTFWPEAGGYLAVDAALGKTLWLRGWLLGRTSLASGFAEDAPTTGISAALTLGATF